MKRDSFFIVILLVMFFLFAVRVDFLMASPESVKENAPTPTIEQKDAGPGPEKVQGPIDSSLVIPKGPQWNGAPILPGGTPLKSEATRLNTEYKLPYRQVLAWYKEALKRYPDARYRDWKEEMYIEDQGGSKWHAIIISKTGGPKTTVTIVKDNWTWILATLVIRFIGVFVVLLILWLGLNISGSVMRRFIKENGK